MIRTALALSLCSLALAAAAAPAPAYRPDASAPRSTVPEKFKWDLSPLYADEAGWETEFSKAQAALAAITARQGTLKDAASVKACLDEYFALRMRMDRVASYANLRAVEDQGLAKTQAMLQRSLGLDADFRSKTAFIRLELLRMDDPAAKAVLADASLAPYRRYVEDLRRRRAHLLGDEAEKVLGLFGDNLWSEKDLNEIPSEIELIFKSATKELQLPKIKDETGRAVQLTLANYGKYRSSKDRRVRAAAVAGLFGTLRRYEGTFSSILAAETKRDVTMARARGYARSVDAYLDRQNVPAAVAESLVASARRNLKPLHRYVALRKRLLKLPEVRLYDLYPPLVPSAKAEVPYEEGLRDLREALAPLGPEYVSGLFGPEMLGRRMADVYPNKDKESGAFCHSLWGHPPVVMLNYMDEVDDASTAAHELGHAMHSWLNMKAQPYPDHGYSSLTAEIASTFNEVLFSKYLLKKYRTDDKVRLFLLGEMLDRIRTTIYRQTLFTEFELKLHGFLEAGTPVTPELLNSTYAGLVKDYYGEGFKMGPDDGVEWAYIPHFYWKHYVFSYAGGLASSIALAEKIEAGDAAARDRYLAMLKKPREDAPVEILKDAGVDLTKPEAVDAAARLMDETITEMEALADKLKL